MSERDSNSAWERGWDGHEAEQLERLARLPLADKLQWLEEAHRLARHLQPDHSREPVSITDVIRSLVEDPDYRKALTQQVEARTADQKLVDQLVAYARGREVSAGHAMVRKVLTEAGVSWEAR